MPVSSTVSPMKMIGFKPAVEFEKGTIYKLLCESYTALLEAKTKFADEYKRTYLSCGFKEDGRSHMKFFVS